MKRIRLKEEDLNRIIRECVNDALNEIGDTQRGQDALGQLSARQLYRDNDRKAARHTTWYAEDANDDQYAKDLKNQESQRADMAYNRRDDAYRLGYVYGKKRFMK